MKRIVALALAVLSLSLSPEAYAEPIKLTGEVSVRYERDTADNNRDVSGTAHTLKLLGETELGAGWSVYARLGAQYATEPGIGDFNSDAYRQDKKAVVSLDQFGVIYKADSLVYKIGRQDATVGTTALLYSKSESNIGKHSFVDGVTVSGAVGKTELSALIAQEDSAGLHENKIYAIRAGYRLRENLSYGFTLGHYQADSESTKHLAMDGTYKFGKYSLTAEIAKSNSNANNKAYAVIWNYGMDEKTAVYVTGFRVEAKGDMGTQSDFDNDNRGVYYGITHKLSEATGLEFVYKKQKTISNHENNTKFEATFNQAL